MSLLNVGSRALLANQAAIQTAGHNIANVNTVGYSRQNVVLATMPGQLTGGGYIGKGVDIQTVLRNHSDLLTRRPTRRRPPMQATAPAWSTSSNCRTCSAAALPGWARPSTT